MLTNGTKLSFPSVYHNDLAFVFGSSSEGRESQINILSYTSFMNLHKTVNDTVRYEIKNTKDANGLPEILKKQ